MTEEAAAEAVQTAAKSGRFSTRCGLLLIIVSLAKLYQSAGKDKKVPYIQVEPFYAECKDNIPPDTFDDMRHSRGKYIFNKFSNNVRVVEIAAVELVKHKAEKLARGDTTMQSAL